MSLNKIPVPDLGDIGEVDLIEIAVKVGDVIAKDDTMVVLESDKASMDVPAPEAGVVKEILVKVGDKLSEGSPLLMLEVTANQEVVSARTSTQQKEPEAEKQSAIESTNSVSETKSEASSAKTSSSQQTILIPDMGDLQNLAVIELLIKPGDQISKDQILLVLESDKASMDVPSPFSGTIEKIHIAIGDVANTGTLVADILATEDASEKAVNNLERNGSEIKLPEKASPAVAESSKPAKRVVSKPPVPDRPALSHLPSQNLVHASPSIRRFARELGADLSKITGSGEKGRVLKTDVQLYIKDELARPKATATSGSISAVNFPEIDYAKFGETETVQLSRIQKVSSVNLHRNWVSIPHVTQFDESDITELEKFRKSLQDEAAKEGVKVTPLIFMLKAAAASLKAFPTVNASLANDGENLVLKKYIHIGVAVDTPAGLVVPVIRDVDKKSVYDLAKELAETSQKAREGKLSPASMQGSSFTISSLGGIGGTAFTPIVNWPDVAILGVSKSQMKPVWNGKDFEPRLMLPLSFSYDHRVIDGAVAARFTTHLSKVLSDIRRIML